MDADPRSGSEVERGRVEGAPARPGWLSWSRWGERLRAAKEIYEGLYIAPYRSAIHREYLRQHDAFLLMGFSDLLGVPNPAQFYMLELYPHLIEEFHEWHRRMGLEHPPEGGFRCC